MSHVASCRYILTGLCWPDVACRTGVENCLDQRRVARDRRRAMDSMNSLKATSFCQSDSANHVPAGNTWVAGKYLYIIHDITSTCFSTSTIIYWWYRNCSCTILMGAVLPDMELIYQRTGALNKNFNLKWGVLWSNTACNLKCRSTSFIPKCRPVLKFDISFDQFSNFHTLTIYMSIHFVAGPNNKKLERSNDVALGNTICTMYIYI